MENADQEHEVVLFHTYRCAYYVQSPSTASHANSADVRNAADSASHSPLRSETFTNGGDHRRNPTPEASRFTLSHYSSSRGSNHYFLQDKKIIAFDAQSHHEAGTDAGGARLIVIGSDGGGDGDGGGDPEDDESGDDREGYYGKKRRGWWRRYFTYRNSDSNAWICLQLSWRAMVSLGIALLFFYIATKPPSPKISVKTAAVRDFTLAEGVDSTGVSTKILTCNCTMDLTVDNQSKLFGLHILPPFLQISFGRLPFATSQGPALYADRGSTTFRLSVGTAGKPMYGAGRSMADMLESGTGLDLTVRLTFISNFRVVWEVLKPRFHHRVECSLVIGKDYDGKRHTQSFNSTCILY